jgi:hypothetical protein
LNKAESHEAKNRELVETASSMLRGEIHLIEGVRRLCDLRTATLDPNNAAFMPIRAIDSETDQFLIGSNDEAEKYLEDTRDDILNACRKLIRIFSK